MKVRAFNLIPGAVIDLSWLHADAPAVVTKVERDCDLEEVNVTFRISGPQGGLDDYSMDFCDEVDVVGLCVHPDDFDDTDFGVGW